MKLQTNIPLYGAKNQIDYNSQLLILGSCFAENIGTKLDYFKFQTLQNPFGILFHQLAIEKLIVRAIRQEWYTKKDIFFLNERWHCFDAHSDLSNPSVEKILEQLNLGIESTYLQLTKATHIILTLGTAWVYKNMTTDSIVANCHKVPQKAFSKKLLSVEEIKGSLRTIIQKIRAVNPKAQLIFAVSPVRHLKDGFVENQRSKAHLIAAIQDTINSPSLGADWGTYFPSYEIMMDELRDYRFYKADLIHPNELAVEYIWEKFKEVWISSTIHTVMDKVDAVQKGLLHRPFNVESKQHKTFLASLEDKITYLKKSYPHMKFSR